MRFCATDILVYFPLHPVTADVDAFQLLTNNEPSVQKQIAPALEAEYLKITIVPYLPVGLSETFSVLNRHIIGAVRFFSNAVMVVVPV